MEFPTKKNNEHHIFLGWLAKRDTEIRLKI